jgi:hypothetical protein
MIYVYPDQLQTQESITQDFSACFSTESTVPERLANPVAKLGLMLVFDTHEAHGAKQLVIASAGNRKSNAFAGVEFVPVPCYPLFRHAIFIRMRNILRGISYREFSGKAFHVIRVSQRERAQQESSSFEGRNF